MTTPINTASRDTRDLAALRAVIAELAPRCGVDLRDRNAVRALIDGSYAHALSERIDPQICHELRGMLILLYRLEASTTEDLGVDGLRRLWRLHSEILARYAPTSH